MSNKLRKQVSKGRRGSKFCTVVIGGPPGSYVSHKYVFLQKNILHPIFQIAHSRGSVGLCEKEGLLRIFNKAHQKYFPCVLEALPIDMLSWGPQTSGT
jgi:hypothetical protein